VLRIESRARDSSTWFKRSDIASTGTAVALTYASLHDPVMSKTAGSANLFRRRAKIFDGIETVGWLF